MRITETAKEFLHACHSVTAYQQMLIPTLAQQLGFPVDQILCSWLEHKLPVSGLFGPEDGWEYHFHGFECDLQNVTDGRFLRVDFGPSGRLDTFTGWGVLQFIMTTKPPWQQYQELREYLAKAAPPYTSFSGSYERMDEIWGHLLEAKCLEIADAELFAFVEAHKEYNEHGGSVLTLPEGTSRELWCDSHVANRITISSQGKSLLKVAG